MSEELGANTMKAQPMETCPTDRIILIKHKWLGWIEAKRGPEHFENPYVDYWLYRKDVLAWAELPEEEPQ